MLSTVQLDKYADVLLWGLNIARKEVYKKNDIILIRYNAPAIQLAEVLYAKLLKKGFNALYRMVPTPTMEKDFYTHANSKQLIFKTPGDDILFNHLNGSIFLHAPASLTHLSGIDPARIGKATLSKKYLRDIIDKREEQGRFSWTLCIFPTIALAEHAGLSFDDYSHQIVTSCFLDSPDPVKEWQTVYKQAQVIKKWLNSLQVSHFQIESENIDLKIVPGEKRKWIGISGHNIPSFELFTSPDYRKTEGIYFADQPSYRSGNYIKGIRVEFKKGVVVNVTAEEGEGFTRKQLEMDKGAKRVGEFSLTDKRFSKIDRFMANTLFDENYGGMYGNCHIALGASYSDAYDGDAAALTKTIKSQLGFNDSALHWDIVNTEQKRVTAHLVTGENVTIYEDGQFNY